jgi:L-sorbose 1-phosphate reductase
MANLAKTQRAVQLVGPDKMAFNDSKEVFKPGPHQILGKVEVEGLCFSDLKLLKQFSSHVRKSEVVSGVNTKILKEIPSYVPGNAPTVPGHEVVIRIEEVGPGVKRFQSGQRFLVQSDYRWIRTASSNAAFGYNFEGGLQEYVLMDERIITSPEGDSMLLPASEKLSASAIALVEPWACVEDAYASKERTGIKDNGYMLVVADVPLPENALANLFSRFGQPKQITWISKSAPGKLNVSIRRANNIADVKENGFDDVIYYGSNPETVEKLFSKMANKAILNIVLCGGKFGRDVSTAVGRIHYGGIRIIGTTGNDPATSMEYIPADDEIREGDKINVIGAGGPMGMMHVIRNICQGVKGVSVYAGDVDDNRLAALSKIATPLAQKNNIEYRPYNATKETIGEEFDYIAIMAPVPELVAGSLKTAGKDALINIFAGIPMTVSGPIDLDTYIEKEMYFIGTSGSTLNDMQIMLEKLETGKLDTNASVAAICGLENAAEGIRAVENRLIAGKILVYPACKGMGLIKLEELATKMPEVDKCLNDGLWTKEAEDRLLNMYK